MAIMPMATGTPASRGVAAAAADAAVAADAAGAIVTTHRGARGRRGVSMTLPRRATSGTITGTTTILASRSAVQPKRPRARSDVLPRHDATKTGNGGRPATVTPTAASHRVPNRRPQRRGLIGMHRLIGRPLHPGPKPPTGRLPGEPSVTTTAGEGSIWSPVIRAAMPRAGVTGRLVMANRVATPATSSRGAAAGAAVVAVAAGVGVGNVPETIGPPRSRTLTHHRRR